MLAALRLAQLRSLGVSARRQKCGCEGYRAGVPLFLGRAGNGANGAAGAVPTNGPVDSGRSRSFGRWPTAARPASKARRTSTSGRSRVSPPKPRRLPNLPGSDGDEYRWMHDVTSAEVHQHLQDENKYAAACLRPLTRRASELHRCMMDRQPEEEGGDRRSVPERLGGHLYYTRRDEGKGFPVYVRRPVGGALDDEQVVLDLGEIEDHGLQRREGIAQKLDNAEPHPVPALGSMKLSSDQRMLACTIDVEGNNRFVLAVFDLGFGKGGDGALVTVLREDAMWDDVVGVEWGSSWTASPSTNGGIFDRDGDQASCYELYYTVPDNLRRPWQVRRVVLRSQSVGQTQTNGDHMVDATRGGSAGEGWAVDSSSDRVVFEERDDAFFADVGKTKDHAFVVVNVHSKTTSEVYLLPGTRSAATADAGGLDGRWDFARNGAGPALLRRRQQGIEYYVDHCGSAFYAVTNSPPSEGSEGLDIDYAGEYRLVRVKQPWGNKSLEGIADARWEPVSYVVDSPSDAAMLTDKARNSVLAPEILLDGVASVNDSGRSGDGTASTDDLAADSNSGDVFAGVNGTTKSGPNSRGTIQEMDLFEAHCVLYESCPTTGSPRLRVVPLADPASSSFVVTPPAPGVCLNGNPGHPPSVGVADASALRPGVNSWFEARTVRFSVSSPVAPEDVYDLCLESAGLELLRRTEVPGSPRFDGGDYSCYTVQVASRDGEAVPLTLVHRKGLQLNGGNRLLLHGYGAYGMSLPIDYHPRHSCMLERGWVLAFAHVRGGGERGKAWHAAGRGLKKWNSFWDFEACAEHLVSAGFSNPSSMGAHVNSAGGLLGGVMVNTRPDLFSAMVMKAPFLGVLCSMRDASLPLTMHEFDEWGDPSTCEDTDAVIRSYCPYENVRRQEYPALLVTASLNDTRVNFWDPAKWVSRVRAANTGRAPVVLQVSDEDGHDGPKNTWDAMGDSAMEMAFLERHLARRG